MEECKCEDLCYFLDDFSNVVGGTVTGFIQDQVKIRCGICRVILLPVSRLYATYAEAEAESFKIRLRHRYQIPNYVNYY